MCALGGLLELHAPARIPLADARRVGRAWADWNEARHYAHKLTIRLKEQRTIDELLDVFEREHLATNDIHLATCWNRPGQMAKRSPSGVARLVIDEKGKP